MALSKPIGYCTCPDCGHTDCEIKEDKNGHAYRFCPECNLQTFTRDTVKSERMKSKMRPAHSESGQETKINDAPKPTQQKPAEKPATASKVGLLLD